MHRGFLIAIVFVSPVLAVASDPISNEHLKFFEMNVRPLLAAHCVECHGADKQQGMLRLDSRAAMMKGGESETPAIVPGNPDESALISAVKHESLEMPPKGKLSEKEIAVLVQWIESGAPWPHGNNSLRTRRDSDRLSERDRQWWAIQPLREADLPAHGDGWARNDIDRFVARKHSEMQFEPAREADRRELARRAYFDLHGLPPSNTQLESFERDPDPKAYEKLVDQLLASPRYGERWAQHWLDLVRYAESDGYNQDAYRPTVWRYRDYVINSFNDNKPYDQFVREQLAGDGIDPEDPETLIATAYLRHPVYEYNLRDVRGQWEVILTDMTDTTSEVFLGLSMGCARCHDHKFDPIFQRDYFRLRAFFTPVYWRDDLHLATPVQQQAFEQQQAKWEAATAEIRSRIDALSEAAIAKHVETWRHSFPADLQAMTLQREGQREPLEKQLAGLCERQLKFARGQFKPDRDLKTDEAKEEYKTLQTELRKFNHLIPKPLLSAFVATDIGPQAPPNILETPDGSEDIKPGYPTIIAPDLPRIASTDTSTGRRKTLADWITRPDNPLTTRVIVNRVWQYHFGRGIAGSASDFGALGDPPTHPELLDYLANRFVDGRWRFKTLHREIMLSATYRQTARREPDARVAQVDPENHYLWRFQPRRLDAEEVRDAMLAVSGELNVTRGGPSVPASSFRRSIYTQKKRNRPDELLSALDRPAGFASVSQRQNTTTPTQALQLLNGDWVLGRARKLAARRPTVDAAWLAILGRAPDDKERATAERFLNKRIGAAEREREKSPQPAARGGSFLINSERERLVTSTSQREGDDFTVEAIASLDSIDSGGETRTLVTRWDGNKANLGWSIDVTGIKSRYQPRNILLQLVGKDKNGSTGYQIVVSNLRFQLNKRQHLVVHVAGSRREVVFTLRDLDTPGAEVESATVRMDDLTDLSTGDYPIVFGGQSVRRTTRQWNGEIEAIRVATGRIADDQINADSRRWQNGLVLWRAIDQPNPRFTWSGSEAAAQAKEPRHQAMTDLCQILLNSNEFFYLH